MVKSGKIVRAVIGAILLVVSLGAEGVCSAGGGEAADIVVIKSKDIAPFALAVKGFTEEVENFGFTGTVRQYILDENNDRLDDFAAELKELNPVLIFAVGTKAALFSKKSFKTIPIVFGMVLNPAGSGLVDTDMGSDGNITGVSLNIPIEEQFEKAKEMIPDVKRIGMLYDAQKKVMIKEKAVHAAEVLGLEVIAEPVNSEKNVSRSLKRVCKEAGLLWAAADPMIYRASFAEHILVTTLRNKVPFMAFSASYVKAGALMAMECDYYDIGKQSGLIAIELIKGIVPGDIPVQPPRKSDLIVNRKTAKTIGVKIPEKLLKEAKKVY